jgi:hypothetical protein
MMQKHHDVFFYSGFRVQVAASPPFLEDGILDTLPSPRGEGAPKGRIGHWRYERKRGGSSQVGDIREHPSAAKKEANPASLRSAAPSKGRGSRGCSLLPLEGGAPKGRRLEGESGIPDTQPSPRGEGAPKGRIGQHYGISHIVR